MGPGPGSVAAKTPEKSLSGVFYIIKLNRYRAWVGRLRKSFSAEGLKSMILESITLKPPLYSLPLYRFFHPAFGHHGQVMQIFQQLFVLLNRNNYRIFPL
jgi:hypothetical protein